jgi:hypothetical protein
MVSDVLLVDTLQSACLVMVRMAPATAEAEALNAIGSDTQTTAGLALALPPEK